MDLLTGITPEQRKALADLNAAFGNAPAPQKPKIGFGGLCKRYADVKKHLKSWGTQRKRMQHLQGFFGSDKDPESFCEADIYGDLGYRTHRHAQKKERGGGEIKDSTINREQTLLQGILNYGVEIHVMTHNPIAHVPLVPENNIRQTKISNIRQLAPILKVAGVIIKALVYAYFYSGLRRLEAMLLRWDEVDWDTGYIHLMETKNGDRRRPHLPRVALEALQRVPRYPGCPHIFTNPDTNKPYHWRWLYTLFLRAVEQAGVKGVGTEKVILHSFRHGFAYRMRREHKFMEKTIMKMGGWKTRSAFDRYGIVDDEECEEAWEAVERASERDVSIMTHLHHERKPPKNNPPTRTHDSAQNSGSYPSGS